MRSTRTSTGARLAACLLVFGLTACVTVPKTELDPSAAGHVRSIALLKIPEPPGISVFDMDGASAADELAGGFAQADVGSNHSAAYAQMLAERRFSFAQTMADSLTRTLLGSGYRVSYLADQVPKLASDGKSYDFSTLNTDADAIMLVWYTVAGYVSPAGTDDYLPWLGARARLFDTRTGHDLYFKTFSVGYENGAKNVVELPSDPRYRYPGFDSLARNVDASVGGMTASIDAIADRIGRDFAQASSGTMPAVAAGAPVSRPAPPPAAGVMPPPVPAAPIARDGLVVLRQPTSLRAQPRPQAALIVVLPAGQQVKVDPRTRSNAAGNWNYVEAGANSGWALDVGVAP